MAHTSTTQVTLRPWQPTSRNQWMQRYNHSQRESLPDQVTARLPRDILTRQYQPGDRIPSERALAVKLNVSRRTVLASITNLAMEALLDRPYHYRGVVRSEASSGHKDRAQKATCGIPTTRFVALTMWRGIPGEIEEASQQHIFACNFGAYRLGLLEGSLSVNVRCVPCLRQAMPKLFAPRQPCAPAPILRTGW